MTEFALSDAVFYFNMWKSRKAHILGDSEADTKPHYVCQYCKDRTSAYKEHDMLDPLSKQTVQTNKAFRAVFRLGN